MANTNCPCPQGYQPDDNGNCVGFSTSLPIVNSTIYTGAPGSQNSSYGILGTNFFPDISALPFPITYQPAPNRFVDGSNTILPAAFNTTGTVWGNSFTTGRLNSVGLWTGVTDGMGNSVPWAPSPGVEWIGFSVCIQVPTTATYCIGIAGDNATRFKLDGTLVFDSSNNGATQWIFNYWNVFPMTLSAGTHIITLEGINYGGSAAFGAEIYTASPAALAAMTSQAQLTAVTLFSTLDQRGLPFQTGLFSGYSCPEGCALDMCGATPVCACKTILPPDPCCFVAQNCKDGTKIVVTGNLAGSIGQIVQFQEFSDCWQIVDSTTCEGAISVTIINTFIDCITCQGCYILTNCDPDAIPLTIQTTTDLSQYLNESIQITGYPNQCWTITPAQITCDSPAPVVVTSSFTTCYDCLPKCYILTDCEGIEVPIKTSDDLSQYVGLVIKLENCPETCWIVTVTTDCDDSVCLSKILTSYADCIACLPPVLPPVPLELRPRMIKPGYTTPGCSPEYTEKVNCTFGEAVYDEMIKKRYGVKMCCDLSVNKWDIKKQLLDLKALFDPELCKPICCEAPTCSKAEINIFQPVPFVCPAPTRAIGIITLPPDPPICSCWTIQAQKASFPFDVRGTSCSGQPFTITINNNPATWHVCSRVTPSTSEPSVVFINVGACGSLACSG